jgi:hypothetical protein
MQHLLLFPNIKKDIAAPKINPEIKDIICRL